jgi:small nuclear ribonucleoprotein (snRNP)-like protein
MFRGNRGASFEKSVVRTPAPGSLDPGSPLAYLRKWLGCRLSLQLRDNRTIEGILCAADSTAHLFIANAIEQSHRRRKNIEKVIVPLSWVTSMEALGPLGQGQAPRK